MEYLPVTKIGGRVWSWVEADIKSQQHKNEICVEGSNYILKKNVTKAPYELNTNVPEGKSRSWHHTTTTKERTEQKEVITGWREINESTLQVQHRRSWREEWTKKNYLHNENKK